MKRSTLAFIITAVLTILVVWWVIDVWTSPPQPWENVFERLERKAFPIMVCIMIPIMGCGIAYLWKDYEKKHPND